MVKVCNPHAFSFPFLWNIFVLTHGFSVGRGFWWGAVLKSCPSEKASFQDRNYLAGLTVRPATFFNKMFFFLSLFFFSNLRHGLIEPRMTVTF